MGHIELLRDRYLVLFFNIVDNDGGTQARTLIGTIDMQASSLWVEWRLLPGPTITLEQTHRQTTNDENWRHFPAEHSTNDVTSVNLHVADKPYFVRQNVHSMVKLELKLLSWILT